MKEIEQFQQFENGNFIPSNSREVSPNWATVKHTRLSFEDAFRNGIVLAQGIFGPLAVNKVINAGGDNLHYRKKGLREDELAARKMLVGYLGEQGYPASKIAEAINLEVTQIPRFGFGDKDWLKNAQEKALELACKDDSDTSIQEQRRTVLVGNVLNVVQNVFETPVRDIIGPKRFKGLIPPRVAGSCLFTYEGGLTLTDTGRRMGGRDHATIIHHLNLADTWHIKGHPFYYTYEEARANLLELSSATPVNLPVQVSPSF